MDFSESTKIVYNRIQKVEPELASKIVGYLLFQENETSEMIRLAFSPDNVILSVTNKVKTELGFISSNHQNASIPQHYHLFSPPMQLFNVVQFPTKICHYYAKGFCKNGINCRFIHGNLRGSINEDPFFSRTSLERLEMELTNMLRSRNGFPIPISSLPFLYHDKYDKTISCEAGYALTALLSHMRTGIRLIERAHGNHLVILAEDVPKYMEYKNEKTEHPSIVARHIYLTFPAESAFSEKEVLNHFNVYGPVEDVRLPLQQKRMFGFVTSVFPQTVRMILAKGNPHFIYGARVLVKPYMNKPRLADRKNAKGKNPIFDGDSKSQDAFRISNGNKRNVRETIMKEHEVELVTERRRFFEF